ncbi:PREDICTED: subtilisin-like protease SBT5.4 [Lupinus angustifolius]|uniref:subtilisin-like protease SBT5.4 n=1 Tax=Lupinus angustifolius TaxID=3871 RepID=UPI00092F6411|nr:PREDICTED: subtilisin-like protease SBT5.4 [Lupinus angustifolius]
MSSSIYHVLLSLLLCFVLQEPTLAIKKPYIVYLGSHSFGQNPSQQDVESVTDFHYDLLGSFVGSTQNAKDAIFYSYNRHINGFAALLDEDEAAMVAKHPSVVSVFESKRRKLRTTHSWDFLGIHKNGVISHDSIWKKTLGEDVIIANLDSGVWPESKSFSDEGIGPVPIKWRGSCDSENFHCNRKLIGAKRFYKGYQARHKNAIFNTARDDSGHGSHTLSTAGGNFVDGASVFGNGNGTAHGGAPKSHVATYKVCWAQNSYCYDEDILAAFDAAISDGVDVISASLSGENTEFFQSGVSIGSFHAVANGIIVVSAAGNEGPNPTTVSNVEPWTFTVAASTIDREFANYVKLGNNKVLKGLSLSEFGLPSDKLYPLVNAENAKAHNANATDALYCKNGTLDHNKGNGKILVCHRYDGEPISQGVEVARVGGVGMILINDDSSFDVFSDTHVLPATYVNFTNGRYILTYINHTKSPLAHISRVNTNLGIRPDPIIASFSSRGPSSIDPTILKPDITAPGVDIIAAYSEAVPPGPHDKRRTPFMTMFGTSMATPHVAGLAGLLKAIHPDWSPAAIKSAIMTTARIKDNSGEPVLDEWLLDRATPLAYGAGVIQPNHAADPGLVYDIRTTDYLNFLCGRHYNSSMIQLFYGKSYTCPESFNIADFNYPSISINHLVHGYSQNVSRTLTNVGSPAKYRVHINAPREVIVSVKPKILRFKHKGEKRKFTVTFTLRPLKKSKADYFYGSLVWTNHKHIVRSPIVVKNPIL